MTRHEGAPGSTITMRDVANAAGVSVATVSHVVNDKPGARIGEETRQRVLTAVKDLGYRQNVLAKTLSQGRSRFIGLVADHIATTPYAGQIIQGAQDEAWKRGYVLLVANTDGDVAMERDAITMMLEYQVEGILYSSWYHQEVDVPKLLTPDNTVLVNCYSANPHFASVVPGEVSGGSTATETLIKAGHSRIVFINTTSPSPARAGRLEGYRLALENAGITYDPDLVLDALPDQEGGYECAEAVVALGATGVFCHNDRVAMGLYDGLRERGLSVPDDISVVGFDNQEVIAAHLRPPLTTVALPHGDLGAAGVRRVISLSTSSREQEILECPPVLRGSVRAL